MLNRKASKWPLLLLSILLFSFLVPREFHFSLGSLQLNISRVWLLFLVPYVLFNIIFLKPFKWSRVDFFAICIFLWPFIAFSVTSGFLVALESGGVLFLETAIPYFLTRIAIRDYASLKSLSIKVLFCITILVLLAVPESITGKFFVHDFSASITGNPFFYSISRRLGLWRAMGPMDHPIILGTICSSGLLIAYALSKRQPRYYFNVVCCLLGTFVSLSSGPLLTAISQVGLATWSKILSKSKSRWITLIVLILIAYILVDIYSNRDPFRVMFSYLLFNTGTGYARYYMWINSIFLVNYDLLSMFFGYGNSNEYFSLLKDPYWQYVMSKSVDSFWLVKLLYFGWPILLFFLTFIVLLFRLLWRKSLTTSEAKERNLIQAWMFAGLSLTLVAFTVDFWGHMVSYYFIVLAGAIGVVTKKL